MARSMGWSMAPGSGSQRSAHTLPRVEGPLAIEGEQLSNAALFDLLEA